MFDQNNVGGLLLTIISDQRQLQFYVYLLLLIAIIATYLNNFDTARTLKATGYIALILILSELARDYRFADADLPPYFTEESKAVSIMTFAASAGGFWMAHALNTLGHKQKGWLYYRISVALEGLANFVEKRTNPVVALRGASAALNTKAHECHPINSVIAKINTGKINEEAFEAALKVIALPVSGLDSKDEK